MRDRKTEPAAMSLAAPARRFAPASPNGVLAIVLAASVAAELEVGAPGRVPA